MDRPSYPNAMVSSQFDDTLKKKIARLEDDLYVSEEDCCDLPRTEPMPYLRQIEFQKLEPHHFGLSKWQPTFRLPDSWMKKIYRHDVYLDTDLEADQPEKLTKLQKEILHEHVKITRKILDLPGILTKFYSRTKPPVDKLLQTLQNQENLILDSRNDNQHASSSSDGIDNIPIHISHRVNSERMVAKLALEKMKTLSENQEKRFRRLLMDRRFMDKLNSLVESYLNENQCLHKTPCP